MPLLNSNIFEYNSFSIVGQIVASKVGLFEVAHGSSSISYQFRVFEVTKSTLSKGTFLRQLLDWMSNNGHGKRPPI